MREIGLSENATILQTTGKMTIKYIIEIIALNNRSDHDTFASAENPTDF